MQLLSKKVLQKTSLDLRPGNPILHTIHPRCPNTSVWFKNTFPAFSLACLFPGGGRGVNDHSPSHEEIYMLQIKAYPFQLKYLPLVLIKEDDKRIWFLDSIEL